MRPFGLICYRERDYLCHTGIEELAIAAASTVSEAFGGAAIASTAAEVGAGVVGTAAADAAITSGLAGAAEFGGAAAGLTSVGGTAATASSLLPAWFPSLSTIGTAASVGGTLLTAKSQANNAAYQQAVARSEAAALQQKANQESAAATRAEITKARQTELVQSRARALSASSGTLASDPGEVKIEGDIAQQGQYNALSALYEGMASAQSDRYQADIDLFKARRVGDALPYQIGGTLLSGISSFADSRLRRNYLLNQYGGF